MCGAFCLPDERCPSRPPPPPPAPEIIAFEERNFLGELLGGRGCEWVRVSVEG